METKKYSFVLDQERKKKIYRKYFIEDINELEKVLEKDLSDWKY